jgi:signal transduction histidine kinase
LKTPSQNKAKTHDAHAPSSCSQLRQALELKRQWTEKSEELKRVQQRTQQLTTENKRLKKVVSETHKRLYDLSSCIIAEEEAGCNRLARQLHDCVGQNMTGLKINLNLVFEELSEPSKTSVGNRLKDSIALASETTRRIREIMTALRCQVLDYDGLMEALQWEANSFTNRTGIQVELRGEPILPRPTPEIETALFRIAQESLTNVFKHAKAAKVRLDLQNKHDIIRLSIQDEGIGFDPEKTSPRPDGGWGLLHMKERIESQGGVLKVRSSMGKGTLVIAEVPTKPQPAKQSSDF